MNTSKTITLKNAHRLLSSASRRLRPQAVRATPRVFCNPDMPAGWHAGSTDHATRAGHDVIVPPNPLRAVFA